MAAPPWLDICSSGRLDPPGGAACCLCAIPDRDQSRGGCGGQLYLLVRRQSTSIAHC